MKKARIISSLLLVIFLQALLLASVHLDPQRFMRVNRQYIVNASAVDKLSAWFQGKLRIYIKGFPDDEITVSKEKVSAVKRWLDS